MTLIILLAFQLKSQNRFNAVFGYMGVGYSNVQFSNFLGDNNSKFAYNPSVAIFGGGGMISINGKFLIGGKSSGGSLLVKSSDNIRFNSSIASGYGQLGYIFYNKNNKFVFPYFGLGGGQSVIRVQNQSASDLDFSKYSLSPNQEKEISFGGFGANLGMSAYKYLYNSSTRNHGFILGLDIGSNILFYNSYWEFDDKNLDNSALVYLGRPVALSFYASIHIGFGNTIKSSDNNSKKT